MTTAESWRWELRRGPAAQLHETTPPTHARRTVQEMEVERAAVVLGSSQPDDDIDPARARAAGVEIVRRRSGGGAVLIRPGEVIWLDVWLPAGDPLWHDDVGRAADWLAEVWVAALVASGHREPLVHTGGLVGGDWSSAVCFAGLGPGEITVGGAKIVGVSQRRTREWARFQCLVHRRWDAAATFGLLRDPGAVAAGLEWAERVGAVGDAPLHEAFAEALPGGIHSG